MKKPSELDGNYFNMVQYIRECMACQEIDSEHAIEYCELLIQHLEWANAVYVEEGGYYVASGMDDESWVLKDFLSELRSRSDKKPPNDAETEQAYDGKALKVNFRGVLKELAAWLQDQEDNGIIDHVPDKTVAAIFLCNGRPVKAASLKSVRCRDSAPSKD